MRIIDYINQGGAIMYILLILNIVGVAMMIAKFFLFNKEKNLIDERADELKNKISGNISGKDSNAVIEMTKQELAVHMASMEKGLNTVKIIAAVSPLLGLLGTVLGVLVAFKVMSKTGLSNPQDFAQGISMALVTTVGGLIVAIPHFIGHNYLIGMLDHIENKLEKSLINRIL